MDRHFFFFFVILWFIISLCSIWEQDSPWIFRMMMVGCITLKKWNTKKEFVFSWLEGVSSNVKHFLKANNAYVWDNKLLESVVWLNVSLTHSLSQNKLLIMPSAEECSLLQAMPYVCWGGVSFRSHPLSEGRGASKVFHKFYLDLRSNPKWRLVNNIVCHVLNNLNFKHI